MNRVAWLGAVSVVGAVPLWGCGSASSGGSPSTAAGNASANAGSAGTVVGGASASAGSGGVGGAGGGQTSAAGSAGAPVAGSGNGGAGALGDSKTEACLAYAIAACARREECLGYSTAECVLIGGSCPDAVFSDGSTRTVEGLKACAEAYKTFPCEKARKFQIPDCVTPGTRQQGEACVYPSQCASLACKMAPSVTATCGVCAKIAKRGEACDAADVECDDGLVCTSGVCAFNDAYRAAIGDACQTDADCPGLDCSSSSHTCVASPTLGMACAEHKHCASDSYCDGSTLLCTARPPAGAACGYDAAYGNIQACALGSICNPSTSAGTANCAKIPAAGEPCLKNPDNGDTIQICTGAAYCDTSLATAACVAQSSAGGPCSRSTNACVDGLDCACPDGKTDTCSPPLTCLAYRFKGQACGTPGAVCHPAYDCLNGTCQPSELHGYFAKSCVATN